MSNENEIRTGMGLTTGTVVKLHMLNIVTVVWVVIFISSDHLIRKNLKPKRHLKIQHLVKIKAILLQTNRHQKLKKSHLKNKKLLQ
nr:MAG TPA: hypothetical protein [Caudoviricetes sp.]